LAVLPATAPAFPCHVETGTSIAIVALQCAVTTPEVVLAFEDDPLSSVLAERSVNISGCGRVTYAQEDRLADLAWRCRMTVGQLVTDRAFSLTRLKAGVTLALPNIPPACAVARKPLKALPGMFPACVLQIVRRPHGLSYLWEWAGDLVIASFPALGGLLAALTALGWGASRFARVFPLRPEERDE
jgi:hypothetical protein